MKVGRLLTASRLLHNNQSDVSVGGFYRGLPKLLSTVGQSRSPAQIEHTVASSSHWDVVRGFLQPNGKIEVDGHMSISSHLTGNKNSPWSYSHLSWARDAGMQSRTLRDIRPELVASRAKESLVNSHCTQDAGLLWQSIFCPPLAEHSEVLQADSVRRKRKRKMNKHKHRKRLKAMRSGKGK